MLYGLHPFVNCDTLDNLVEQVTNTAIIVPPKNNPNKNVSQECLNLLNNLLQKKVNERINWPILFDNQWVKKTQATSPDSESSESSSPSKKCILDIQPIITISMTEKVTVIEDYCDGINENEYIFHMD